MQETQETRVQHLDQEDPLEWEMAIHSSILAWKIPWTEKTVHVVLPRVGQDWYKSLYSLQAMLQLECIHSC